jgi:hypothetical protein
VRRVYGFSEIAENSLLLESIDANPPTILGSGSAVHRVRQDLGLGSMKLKRELLFFLLRRV